MIQHIAALCRDDEGAVTVDWVVLTAAIVGLSVAVMAMFEVCRPQWPAA